MRLLVAHTHNTLMQQPQHEVWPITAAGAVLAGAVQAVLLRACWSNLAVAALLLC